MLSRQSQDRSGREFVPRGVGVEKPARWRRPNDLLGTNWNPKYSPSRRGFPPRTGSCPPCGVDNVTQRGRLADRPRACSCAPSPSAAARSPCGRRWATRSAPSPSPSTPTGPRRLAAGLRSLGVGPADRVVMLMANRPEFHVADMAVLLLGATPDLDLQLVVAGADRVPRRARGRDGRDRRDTSTSSSGSWRCAPTSPTSRHIVVVEPDGAAGVEAWDDLLTAAPVDLESAAAIGAARRPGDDHLHVGHDWRAQGRDARPRQHRVDGREPAHRVRRRRRSLAARLVPAHGAHRRAGDHAITAASRSPTR